MNTIRLQNLIPEVYTEESRDFQVLCRLYDSIFNGIKYDADSIKYITDTKFIQSSLLPLLETKLGFFTKKTLTDTEMRYILMAFPDIVKNKGSLKAIKQLVNVCLKLTDITGEYTISYSDKETVINGVTIKDHTIIVGINTMIENLDIINEIGEYIVPTGFNFYIYYFKNYSALDEIIYNEDVRLLYASSNLTSQIRGTRDYTDSVTDYTMPLDDDELSYDLLGGVDVAWINSIDDVFSDSFVGFYDTSSNLPAGSQGDLAITYETVNNVVYPVVYYYNASWNKLNFRGFCELSSSNPQVSNPQNYDVVCSYNNKYLVYQTNSWTECNYRGMFNTANEVIYPQNNDLILLTSNVKSYKLYKNGSWIDVSYKATYSNENQIDNSYKANNNLIILNGGTYYMYLNSVWNIITDSIYFLKKELITN